jgi:glyoxylase-like metal-dependent hydrolase (beta-lactamase superfamily II)
MSVEIKPFYDPSTSTLTYVVHDPESRDAVVIDPVLDYDPLTSSVGTKSTEAVFEHVARERLKVHWVLETHAHADHLSASQLLKSKLGGRIAIGRRITEVQQTFKDVFDLGEGFRTDGSQFDHLLSDGATLQAGKLVVGVIATPGHTPACVTYRIEDAVFTGDALLIEDYGTGRCDFPRGSADELYTSIHEKLYALPDETRVFVGHDYRPLGRALRCETTIAASKEANVQLRADTTREEFVARRSTRDARLEPPRILYPSIQVNIDAGRLPNAHANGRRYLVMPLSAPAADLST